MGIAALVLGIISIVIGLFGAGFQWIGIILGVLGVVFGALGRKDPEKKSIATAGLVCSIVGLVLSIVLYIACVAVVREVTDLVTEFSAENMP